MEVFLFLYIMKKSSNNINARLAIDNAKNVDGIHTFSHSFNDIGVLLDSAFQYTIIHAADQIGVILQPKPTQNTKAHHNISTQYIHFDCNIVITGIKAIAIGILPISADNSADHHNTNIAVSNILDCANVHIASTARFKTPACSIQPTSTNNDTKNTKTDNSTFLNIDFGSL